MTQQEAEVKLKVNSKEALDKINKLEQEAEQLRQKFNDCFRKGDTRGLTETTKKLNKVNKEIMNLRTNAANIQAAMKRIDEASPRDLQRTLKMINNELNSGRVQRGSKEWKEYCEQLKKVKRELAEINEEMDDQGGLLDNLKDKFNDWGASAAAAVAAFAGVVMSGKAAVQAYAEMEAEEANVRKFTGMTAEEVKDLNEEFKKIDTRTSRQELNQLAQEAGRLGKQSKEDVLGFVIAANQINVALDDLGEGATLTLSKLTGIFGDEARLGTEKSLLAVGSVINELSQNCSASASYLADFSQRMAGVGAQAKMTIPQIMAFAAVLDSQGQNLEASATALSQLIMKLYQDPAKFAKAAGLDVKKFTDLLKSDANEAVLVLLDTLNKMGGMDKLAPVFEEMGTDGARASAVLAALAGNIDTVRKQQVEANIAFNEATSVTKEYDVQNNTVQAGLDKAKKRFNELAVSLGEKLLPVMRYAISGSSMMIRVLSSLVDFVIDHKGAIISLAIGIGTYTVAVNAATVATKGHELITKAITTTSTLLKGTVQLLRIAYYGLTNQIKKATVEMNAFNTAIKRNPFGIILAVITTVISAIITYNQKLQTAKERAEELRRENEQWKKSISDINEESAEYAKAEIARLKKLYDAAIDEKKAKDERIAAAKELQKLYPDYFAKLTTEAILVGNAKKEYDNLTNSILNSARARAAADRIVENEGKLLTLQEEEAKLKAKMDADAKKLDAATAAWDLAVGNQQSYNVMAGDNSSAAGIGYANVTKSSAAVEKAKADYETAKQAYESNLKRQKEITDTNKALADKYGKPNMTTDAKEPAIPTAPIGEPERERKEREKRQREAAKAEREAQKKLKEEIDQQKAIRDRDEAANIAAYSTGQISYTQFIERKNQIDLDYINNRKKVYEKANRTETDEYAALLKEEEELKAKSLERQKTATLREIETEHKSQLNKLAMQFFDPKNPIFQNQKSYNQALLVEDLDYLNKKLELYSAGSEEWEQINAQINERIAQDQLDKQKETAAAVLAYSKEYQKLDRESRLAHEEDLLKQLHDMGIFSEEEYQKALQSIRRKYQSEETQAQKAEIDKRHKEIEDEFQDAKDILANSTDIFGKTLLDMMVSWQEMMSDMANNGEGFWTSFANLAQSTLSLVSAMMSQFTAYSNAQRDLELANIENRYDKEIKAAGKNTKKVEELEKKKEAEVAETKKKYNDRAMKMEVAQAIAQTSVNAILGYQAGLKFPFPASTFMPAVLAGLAVAQGAIQIATIKKQHEAQAAGYYEGGFTGGKKYKKEAGVVHEGEFVANHNAVNNPQLSGLFHLLDYAQRNNTVGSLTAEDVSNALGQGQGVSARGEVAGATPTIVTNSIDTSALDTLNALLADGIEAVVILDGERGLHRKYTHFQKLINNPKRND